MQEVLDYLNSLLCCNDVVVLGCSFGPDSMCLLSLLTKIREEKKIKIICAHVNHNIRVKESAKEMVYMENYCKEHDIIFEKMIIKEYGDDNFHNEARTIRYNFFENLITKYNGKYLMTAHHGDDLIETILMRIVRGSNMSGYGGFKKEYEKDGYTIIRPLITVTKQDILDYDKKNKVPFAIDKSNFKQKYTRNRYRKIVLPFLKKEESNVHLKFLKFSESINMYENFVLKERNKALLEVFKNDSLDIEKFKKLDCLIQNSIINYLLEKFYEDDLILISDVHSNMIKKLIYSKRSNGVIYLPNSVRALKSYNSLKLEKITDQIDSYEIEISDHVFLPNGKNISVIKDGKVNDNNYCRLCSSDITLPLIVRTRKSGDKMNIKGMDGKKKIKDIFINSKVPIVERDLWPVVVDSSDKIVWIPGLKKSNFDVPKNKSCDIILWYH